MVQCVGHQNQETSLPDENIKSSGLRVPSPKIGFFEEVSSYDLFPDAE